MTVDDALGTWAAITRIDTFLVLTGQVVWALVIACAFWSLTTGQGISAIAIVTVTACLVVVVYLAQCISSALSKSTWIRTFAVYASFCWGAFAVGSAANFIA